MKEAVFQKFKEDMEKTIRQFKQIFQQGKNRQSVNFIIGWNQS